MITTYQKRGRQVLYTGKELTRRWQVLLLTAMSITVALSLWSCRPPSGAGQGIDHGQMMQGANELQKALELPGGVLGRVAGAAVADRARREARRSLENLRRLLESPPPVSKGHNGGN